MADEPFPVRGDLQGTVMPLCFMAKSAPVWSLHGVVTRNLPEAGRFAFK